MLEKYLKVILLILESFCSVDISRLRFLLYRFPVECPRCDVDMGEAYRVPSGYIDFIPEMKNGNSQLFCQSGLTFLHSFLLRLTLFEPCYHCSISCNCIAAACDVQSYDTDFGSCAAKRLHGLTLLSQGCGYRHHFENWCVNITDELKLLLPAKNLPRSNNKKKLYLVLHLGHTWKT
jgi:hypothetical protein